MQLALGLIETKGLIGAIEAADAGTKAANVKLLAKEYATGALVLVKFEGEVAAVKSAVDAGSAAAQRVGQLVSAHVIPRPDAQIDDIIYDSEPVPKKEAPSKKSEKKSVKKEKVVEESSSLFDAEEDIKEVAAEAEESEAVDEIAEDTAESEPEPVEDETKEEVIDEEPEIVSDEDRSIPPMAELEILNVHQLRKLARSYEDFPIKGRDISKANRGTLLDYFKSM